MRKLAAALVVAFSGIGAAQAAPEAAKCTAKFDPMNPASMNCFADEIFILDGSTPYSATVTTPIADCADKAGMAGVKDSKNCLFGADQSKYLTIEPVEAAALKAIELIRAKQPQLPEWDEVVVFTADFGPTSATGPLFYRAANATIQPINPVNGIGLPVVDRDPTKPYIGIVSAGNTKTLPANLASGAFGPCGAAPRRPIDDPAPQTAAALCAPTLYSYFDALAQATANLYGPYLKVDAANFGSDLWSMPAIKTTLVGLANGVVSAKIMGGPATNVWNGLVNTRGSILGGNTFTDNGNGTFSITRPPAFQGVSAPYESSQALRFQALDLYAMGMLPSTAVPPIQSFMHAAPGDVYQPAGINGFSGVVGPAMGTRVSGVSIRGKAGSAGKSVPRLINFGDVVGASGGERTPAYGTAPQQIRQLWVMVAKPLAMMDIAAADGGAKKEDQLKDQSTQLSTLQRARRAFGQYFYTLTSYKGRVYTTGDGATADDNAYWEFGGARDDAAAFKPQGALKLAINGQEEIPNSGGKQLSVLRVTETSGTDGRIKFDRALHPIRIDGKQDVGSAPANVLSIRMRVPSDANLLAELKKDSSGEKGFYSTFIFEGGGKSVSFDLPNEKGFLVPDGKFRTYAVNVGANADFKAGVWDSFTFIPSNRAANDIEIEFIKVGWVDGPKDADKNCADADEGDGWIDNVEDNCPRLFNPDQADGNNDGVGDACEDYDGDNKLNACDNCPTTTNTSQRDANGNKIGDACDGSSSGGCFFQESAVAGDVTPGSALFGASLVVFGVMVGGALRRRRRR